MKIGNFLPPYFILIKNWVLISGTTLIKHFFQYFEVQGSETLLSVWENNCVSLMWVAYFSISL